MNDKQRIMELRRNIDTTQGNHKYGCVRFHKEKEIHLRAKIEKAIELWKIGHHFATEIKMKNGDIYDVIDWNTGEHWEFETDMKEDKKRGKRIQL